MRVHDDISMVHNCSRLDSWCRARVAEVGLCSFLFFEFDFLNKVLSVFGYRVHVDDKVFNMDLDTITPETLLLDVVSLKGWWVLLSDIDCSSNEFPNVDNLTGMDYLTDLVLELEDELCFIKNLIPILVICFAAFFIFCLFVHFVCCS